MITAVVVERQVNPARDFCFASAFKSGKTIVSKSGVIGLWYAHACKKTPCRLRKIGTCTPLLLLRKMGTSLWSVLLMTKPLMVCYRVYAGAVCLPLCIAACCPCPCPRMIQAWERGHDAARHTVLVYHLHDVRPLPRGA